jgi:glycosyltransferase involved in cell wall biosynthesis
MKQPLRIVMTVTSLSERYGGPSRTVSGLADALTRQGVGVDIIFGYHPQIDGDIVRPSCEEVNLYPTQVWQKGRKLRLFLDFKSTLVDRVRAGAGLIHDNGLWLHCNWVAWRVASMLHVPYVLSPRGMVEQWALDYKRMLKKTALMLYQQRILESTALFVATSILEYESIRRLGLRQPVAILPNGVDIEATGCLTEAEGGKLADRTRVVLFLSRIHLKKGIENLLQAWALLDRRGWLLRIAGPDEDGYLSKVQQMARQLGIADHVQWIGAVADKEKTRVYRDADVFVLPSYSENFGVVVAEALAHGLPVITTKGTPWKDLEAVGCGWWIDIGVAPLVAALREAMSLSDAQRRSMGQRGREYVRSLSWNSIAWQAVEVYRWLLGRGGQPACVRTD